ncbi:MULTISPECIES: AMP-binding protein [unclassified Streptomyces]|uniref:AMP-binding protein n=1 Tax=unclassified Streptomyces TaxID=2593676 RepID=UPI0033A495C7
MNAPAGLVAGFLTQVRHRPDATALIHGGEHTTYRALYEAAGRERERLAVLGTAPHDTIGVLARTSPAAIALVLAGLLSERPLLLPSPAPAGRLADLAAQAGCARVLVPAGEPVPVRLPPSAAGALPHPDGERPALLFTTSGATAPPRIVPLARTAVDRFTTWAARRFGIGPGTTVLGTGPLAAGAGLLDLWTPLAAGATVVLAEPGRAADATGLLELLTRHDIHVVAARPPLYGPLTDAARATGTTLNSVRHAVLTGRALPDRTVAALPRLFPRARLHNLYGCTETSPSLVHEIDTGATVFPPVPVGRPLPGVRTLVLGAHGTPVDGPGTGELYVSTPFQSPGYLGRTGHRDPFTAHPLGADDGRTWFRTGDLVRRDADGLLHLTGRAGDTRTTVRGTRHRTGTPAPAARRVTAAQRPPATTRRAGRAAPGRPHEPIPVQGRTS